MFHVKQVSREWWGGVMERGADTRLAALLPRFARARVPPARDAEHTWAGMHRMMSGSRDEGPEVRVGWLGVKAKVSGSRNMVCVA